MRNTIMKRHAWIAVVVLALLVSGVAFSQTTRAQDPAKAKADGLEKDVADARAQIAKLGADLAATQSKLDGVLRYLDAQSKAAKAMVDVLQASETAGFTYGINPNSRTLMLKGWRDQLAAAQQTLPAAAPAPAAKSDTPAK
jgi:hypothetical protein